MNPSKVALCGACSVYVVPDSCQALLFASASSQMSPVSMATGLKHQGEEIYTEKMLSHCFFHKHGISEINQAVS